MLASRWKAATAALTLTAAALLMPVAGGVASAATPTSRPIPAPVADQCGKPLAQRVGDWVCYASTPAPQPKTAVTPKVITPFTQTGKYCRLLTGTLGCWSRQVENIEHVAYFQTDTGAKALNYGKGAQIIGVTEVETTWVISGPSFVSTIFIRNNHSTAVTQLDLTIQNGAQNVNGSTEATLETILYINPISHGFDAPGGRQIQFRNLPLADRNSRDHESVVKLTWQIPGAAWDWDYWTVTVKSPVAHDFDTSANYDFRYEDQSILPGSPWSKSHYVYKGVG